MALPASNHSFKKKASQRKIWPEVDRSTNQVQPDFWNQLVGEMERKKKEFGNTFEDELKKIKNVFTIDYIGNTHRKLQLDAEPSWKSMQKFQNEPWNERINKGIKKGPGIKLKTAQFLFHNELFGQMTSSLAFLHVDHDLDVVPSNISPVFACNIEVTKICYNTKRSI